MFFREFRNKTPSRHIKCTFLETKKYENLSTLLLMSTWEPVENKKE